MIRTAIAVIMFFAAAPVFEVASVKPSDSAAQGMSINRSPGGRFNASNVPLRALITFAWDVRDHQVAGGPAWINSDRFDIAATPEGHVADDRAGLDTVRLMVRALLLDRFRLAIHQETREMQVYSLVAAKSGSKLTPVEGCEACKNGIGVTGNGRLSELTGTKASVTMLAQVLASSLHQTVLDDTGLTGKFDFKLTWAQDLSQAQPPGVEALPDQEGPSIFTAIQEQLGLRLEGRKAPVEIIVVDRAEKPGEN